MLSQISEAEHCKGLLLAGRKVFSKNEDLLSRAVESKCKPLIQHILTLTEVQIKAGHCTFSPSQLIRGIVEVIRMGFTAYLHAFNNLYVNTMPYFRPPQR